MQEILWTMLEILANLCESFLCINFIIKSFAGKCKIAHLQIAYIIGTLIMTVIITVLNSIIVYEGILGLLYAVYFIIFSMVFLHGTIQKKIFISLLTVISLVSTAMLSGNILSVVFKNHNQLFAKQTLERFIYMVVGIALVAYIFAILLRFTSGKKQSLSFKEWSLILSVLLVSFLIFIAIHIPILEGNFSPKHSFLLMLAECGLILVNIICLYITVNLSETHNREEQLIADKKRVEYSQKYAQTVKEQYEQTRRLRHDMKQYYTVLDRLIADKKYDEARGLISENYKSISHSEVMVDVGNDFVNSILNTKLTLAKSLGIDVICSAEKDLSGIESADLCNLIGNLLDNAIEAAQICEPEKRSIELNISSSSSRLNITVRNSISYSILKYNPKFATTKADSSEHGFGIKTIKSIAEKYGGTTDFYEENLIFVCRITMFKNNEKVPIL